MDSSTVNEVYIELSDYLAALGVENLAARGEPLIIQIDDSWMMAVHAVGDETILISPPDCMSALAEPYTYYLWYNGWLAGVISPVGGWIANGETANVKALQEALL